MLIEIVFLLIGIVITFIIQNFVFPLLPVSIRDFTKYHKKNFLKILRHEEINIELVVKTKNYDKDISIDEINELIKTVVQKEFIVSSTNTKLILTIPIGQDNVTVEIIPIHHIDNNNDMKFESLECRFITKCSFSKLKTAIMNFREAQHKIEDKLYEIDIPRFNHNLSLTYKLKSLHEITNILENTHFESMNAELNTGQRFEIGKDKITIYDKEISNDTIILAKKMIVLYD